MTQKQYDLIKLNEELSEVQKEVCKALRFGLDDINPKTKEANKDAIQRELIDVFVIASLFGFNCGIEVGEASKRIQKYNKWCNYSKTKGILIKE